MKIEYYTETDTLSIVFAAGPFEAIRDDEQSPDGPLPDVLILRDGERIGEIVIEGASGRIDMAELRRQISFEEVRPDAVRSAA